MYSTCIPHVFHMYSTCILHVFHMCYANYSTRIPHVFHTYSTCIPHVQSVHWHIDHYWIALALNTMVHVWCGVVHASTLLYTINGFRLTHPSVANIYMYGQWHVVGGGGCCAYGIQLCTHMYSIWQPDALDILKSYCRGKTQLGTWLSELDYYEPILQHLSYSHPWFWLWIIYISKCNHFHLICD